MRLSFASSIRTITAKLNGTYDFSSLQIPLPEALAKSIMAWGKKNIPDENLHDNAKDTKGREDEIHVTLLYGIKVTDNDGIRKFIPILMGILGAVKPFKVRLGLVTLFRDKPDYDVVKIEAESSGLQKLHYKIRNSLGGDGSESMVKNNYPTYQSHCTIGYIKKSTADDLNGNEDFLGKTFTVDKVIFSIPNGHKIPITLEKGE